MSMLRPGNSKGGSITVQLTSCLFWISLFANKNKNCQLSYSGFGPVKQEVNGIVILPPLVFPAQTIHNFELQKTV
jgi:hypothetical protein